MEARSGERGGADETSVAPPGDQADVLALADELALRWIPFLSNQNWAERLALLHQIHEQLQEDLEDIELYSQISPAFILRIVDALAGGPVASLEQAHIYANSGDAEHRRLAGEWFAQQPRRPQPVKL